MTALITLDRDQLPRSDADAHALVQAAVDDVNRDRSRFEQIKRFVVLPRDFTIEDGEVTPTLKLKRRSIEANFAAEIHRLYAE